MQSVDPFLSQPVWLDWDGSYGKDYKWSLDLIRPGVYVEYEAKQINVILRYFNIVLVI